MGPGFDCLGMALDIWNHITVELGASNFTIHGEGKKTLPTNKSNLVYKSFALPFQESGEQIPSVSITCNNEIPINRGLGSSSTSIIGGLIAGNNFCEHPLSQQELLNLAIKMDGHPDNASTALNGGCQIVASDDQNLVIKSVPIAKDLKAVIFIPDMPMPTKKARSILSAKITRDDAVYNISRVALLITALTTGDLTHLDIATQDRIHQPDRQKIFPAMNNIFRAALASGAYGVFLSGAGSSILALTRGREMTIGYEMAEAASKSGIDGFFKVTNLTTEGAQVVSYE